MQIAIPLFPGFTALDVIGPYQVFTSLPGAEVVLCAADTGPVVDDVGLLRIEVAHVFGDVPRPDVIVAPGGFVTFRLARNGDEIVDWIRSAHDHTRFTASVCTGSLLLAAAGLLTGERATSHWIAYDELAASGVEPTGQRVVESGKVMTAAGVSAGIDLALQLVDRLAGPEMAQAIQLGIEYDPQPAFNSGSPSTAPAHITQLVRGTLNRTLQTLLSEPTNEPTAPAAGRRGDAVAETRR